jgi:hypothetical protein
MKSKNKNKERRIRRLEADIKNIEEYHYSFVEHFQGDIDARIYAAEEKKKLLVRSLIIETHLTIEDFIDSLLQIHLIKRNSRTKTKTPRDANIYFDNLFEDGARFLSGNNAIGFKKKIVLLRILGVVGRKLYNELDALNSLRNRCSHTWALNAVIRKRVKRSKRKRYVLEFDGKNLFNADSFISFLIKYNKVFHKIIEKTRH